MSKPGAVIDNVVSLAKRRGFVYPCGEIYGGTRSAWDYGPLGVELKENIKRQWWKAMVTSRDDVVGLDSSIILPRETWVASGHVGTFTDPLVECLNCHRRRRQDHLQTLAQASALAYRAIDRGEDLRALLLDPQLAQTVTAPRDVRALPTALALLLLVAALWPRFRGDAAPADSTPARR